MKKRAHITVVEGEDPSAGAVEQVPVLENEAVDEPQTGELPEDDDWFEEEGIESRDRSWVIPAVAGLFIAAWSVFFVWANRTEALAGGNAQQWVGLIVDWSVPVLLVLAVWILGIRNSSREAVRYSRIAHDLSEESALLESRLITVNRELSLAREFLGSQSRDLEYLGRSASEKISEHADRLQELIRDNGDQVGSIQTVSSVALENMQKLRDNLPVIANSARDVSNQIGGAGRSAQDQLNALVGGFERLNQFGEASERQVVSLRKRVDEAISAFVSQANELEEITKARFAALAEGSEIVRNDLQTHEIEALSALRARSIALRSELAEAHSAASDNEEHALANMRERIDALKEDAAEIARSVREGEDAAIGAWSGQIEAMRTRLEEAVAEIRQIDAEALEAANLKLKALFEEANNIDARISERNQRFDAESLERAQTLSAAQDEIASELETRMAALDAAIAERREIQREQLGAMAKEGEALGERINALGDTFNSIAAQGHEARETLAGGIDALVGQLRNSREALDGTDQDIVRLTDASVRLLELIQASAKQSSEQLPKAMHASEARLAEIENRAKEIHTLLDQSRLTGETLTEGMAAIEERTRATMEGFDTFQTDFDDAFARQIGSVEQLRASLASLSSDSNEFADQVQGELRKAITALENKAKAALSAIEDEQTGRINRIAEDIGNRSAAEIERALAERTENALAELDTARNRSNDATRDMTQHLRDQLGRLNELTVNLESRITHAREQATDTIDGDFARRVALITESLNSNAIDIAKALSSEVTDTAWASYLRGDRGIFTRRAVRLLDSSEAREIAELYDNDSDFREHVNRYIHDFEAMLRTMLSTRDGNAVSVTLLSSDMGKLYVALAQALERLRQ